MGAPAGQLEGLSSVVIAVIRTGALGDVLLTLPAVHALRLNYPGSRIQVVGSATNWSVAGPCVDEVLSADSGMFASMVSGDPTRELRAWARQIELIVAFTSWDPRPAATALDIPVIWRTPFPPPGIHASSWLLEAIPGCATGDARSPFRHDFLGLSATERAAGTGALAGLGLADAFLLHPGAGSDWKRWAPERFAEVAEALRRSGHTVGLVIDPADEAVTAAVQSRLSQPLPVIREVVRKLAGLLSASRGFLGVDSGVTHLAAMSGIPVVALFGPTDPANWAPLGNTQLVRHCKQKTKRQGEIRVCRDLNCLHSVSAGEALEAIATTIARRRASRKSDRLAELERGPVPEVPRPTPR